MDFSAQRLEAIQQPTPIGFQTQGPGSNFMNQPSASQKSADFRGAPKFRIFNQDVSIF
jgi:hypothetical protein